MKSLVFSKVASDHQLGHLYEHIFYIWLDSVLRERGYFPTLDYSLDAYTQDGVIVFNLEIYNETIGREIEGLIKNLGIDLNSEITDIAIKQLEAEYKRSLVYLGCKPINAHLSHLDNEEWVFDDNTIEAEFLPVQVFKLGDKITGKELLIKFTYGNVTKSLMPLSRQVLGLTLNVVASDVADTYGGFVLSEAYAVNKNKELTATIQFADDNNIDVGYYVDAGVKELIQCQGYDRLLSTLRNIEQVALPPSSDRTFNDTGVKMDAEKRCNIATRYAAWILAPVSHHAVSLCKATASGVKSTKQLA